jgi:hypothetical protein
MIRTVPLTSQLFPLATSTQSLSTPAPALTWVPTTRKWQQLPRAEGDRLVQMMRERLLYQQHQQPDVISLYDYSTDYR